MRQVLSSDSRLVWWYEDHVSVLDSDRFTCEDTLCRLSSGVFDQHAGVLFVLNDERNELLGSMIRFRLLEADDHEERVGGHPKHDVECQV